MADTVDVMASVEKMLANEKSMTSAMPKAAAGYELDLNEGAISLSH